MQGPIKPGAELFAGLLIIQGSQDWPLIGQIAPILASDWLIKLHVIYVLKEP